MRRAATATPRGLVRGLLGAGLAVSVIACSDLAKLAGTPALPSDTQDPKVYQNAAGAMGMYHSALLAFHWRATDVATPENVGPLATTIVAEGLVTDELAFINGAQGCQGSSCPSTAFDRRALPEGENAQDLNQALNPYNLLQRVRAKTAQAIGALAQYAPDSVDLRAEMYLVQGYAELFLADQYCSGVPLSTLDYGGDYTYQAGSTTAEVYRHAITRFDTALTLVKDSTRVQYAAAVGKGRALLALGLADSAARAVANVPDGFVWAVAHQWLNDPAGIDNYGGLEGLHANPTDGEGQVGLHYAGDPRSAVTQYGTTPDGLPQYFPVKYGTVGGVTPIPVADWVEARLIRAEAALRGPQHDVAGWLAELNYLRAHAAVPGAPVGTLPPLADPGASLSGDAADSARVDLLFAERAEWLYLTGHRQGDLRRLVRPVNLGGYGRRQDLTFPSGRYPLGGVYGTDVTYPIPWAERQNPLFTGCLDRRA